MTLTRCIAVSLSFFVFSAGYTAAQTKKAASAARPVAKPKGVVVSTGTSVFANSRDSLSYSVGVNIAQSMKQQGMIDINTNLMARGVSDALKGQTLLLPEAQVQQIMMAYMQKQHSARQAESGKAAEGNKKIGAAFMAENKTKAGVKTTASGLQYLVEKEGTGAKPTPTDRVKVHYTGKLLDGKEFDSSVRRGAPAEFGVTEVIKGWTEVLQLMPVGSKWKVFILSDIAYGDRGMGGDIGPGATLVFDIELLDIVKTN